MTAGGLFAAIWRRRWWVIVPVAVATALTAAWLSVATPMYRSTVKILIESQETSFTRPELSAATQERLDTEAVRSQVQLIESVDLSREIVDRLDLAAVPEFERRGAGNALPWRLLALVGITRDASRRSEEQKVLDKYYERLTVYPIEGSRVIAIEFSSHDPQLAARVANAVADGYIDMQRAAKRESMLVASSWLGGQIETLRQRVSGAERRVEEFRRENGLFANQTSREQGAQTLSDQQLAELTSQLAEVRTQKSDAQARARMISQMMESGGPIEATEVLNSPIIQNLTEQQAQSRRQLAELSSTLGPLHPRIRELNSELADLRRQIRGEAETIVRALENDARVATEREMALLDNVEALKAGVADSNEKEVQLRALQREAASQRELLESMMTRFTEANAREAFAALPADARIISRAAPASAPYFPKKAATLIAVVIATTVLAGGLVVTMELMKGASGSDPLAAPRIPMTARRQRADLFARLDVPPVAGGWTKQADNTGLAAIGDAIGDSLTGERAQIVLMTSVRRVSALPDLALRLSRHVASLGHRVVVVDTAFGEGMTAKFGDGSKGLGELLTGRAAFESVLFRDPGSRVHVIPAGTCPADSLILVSSDRMDAVLEALGQTYDVIVLLAPAINRRAEARLLARKADFGVLAVRSYGADTASRRARERLHDAGVDEVAVVTVDDDVKGAATGASEGGSEPGLEPLSSAASAEATSPRAIA